MAGKLLVHLRQQWLGALALLLVLTGGTAYALDGSNTVFTDDIVNGEVRAIDIAPDAVRTEKIRNGDVRTDDLGANAVRSGHILDGEVRSADVLNASLTGDDVANESLTGVDITDDSVQGIDVFDGSLTGDDIDEEAVPGLKDPRGYAEVFPSGVVTANSSNVEQADVVKPATTPDGDPLVGYYCFFLPYVVRHVQVTPRSNNRVGWDATAGLFDSTACSGVESAVVETFTGSGAPAEPGFYVAFFD